jgi:cysteine-rich repeat protein
VRAAACGDGVLSTGEECDDGNRHDGDACSSACVACGPDLGDARASWTGNGHCYTRHDAPRSWLDARAACIAEGGHLATLVSAEEQAAFERGLGLDGRAAHWIGLSNLAREQSYEWTTREGLVSWRWAADQPDPRIRSGCVSLGPGPAGDGPLLGWSTRDCTRRRPYVCERPRWLTHPRTGHVYRAVYDVVSWAAARTLCDQLGAHLATVADDGEEAFILANFFGETWLGARKVGGAFAWTTGEPFSFRAFAATEPDDRDGRQDCLALARDRRWHDRPCDAHLHALCEREPAALPAP